MEDYVGIRPIRSVQNFAALTGRCIENDEEARINNEKAQVFCKQKEEERKVRVKKRKELTRKMNDIKADLQQKEEKEEEEKREQYMKEVLERCEQTKIRLELHEKEREEFKKPVKIEHDYAHDRIQKKYEDQILTPNLEQKKILLENLRNFHKPINRSELDEHDKNFLVTLKRKQDEKRIKRELEMNNHPEYNPKKYTNKFLTETQERKKEREIIEREKETRVAMKAIKMDQYAKLVKEMHYPKVSTKKKTQMQIMIKSLDLNSKPSLRNKPGYSLRNSSVNATETATASATDTNSIKKGKHRHSRSQADIDWKKFNNPMIPKEPKKLTSKKEDYLLKRRIRRDEKEITLQREGLEYPNPYFDWKSNIDQSLSNEEYQTVVIEKARAIESLAKMTAQTCRVSDDIDAGSRADDMMISALEAKLSVLNKI
jgi:hypothetical protein